MTFVVTQETPEEIEEMGIIGRLVENCTDCRYPTRYWAGKGEFPLCQKCCDNRNQKFLKEPK